MNEDLVYAYTGYLTVTDKPQPLSAEWGEDTEAAAVDIVNPLYALAAGTTGGAATIAGAGNGGDILVGNRNGQHRPFLPGGNTGIEPVSKVSDKWVRARTAGDTFRILFEVYKKRKADEK